MSVKDPMKMNTYETSLHITRTQPHKSFSHQAKKNLHSNPQVGLGLRSMIFSTYGRCLLYVYDEDLIFGYSYIGRWLNCSVQWIQLFKPEFKLLHRNLLQLNMTLLGWWICREALFLLLHANPSVSIALFPSLSLSLTFHFIPPSNVWENKV